jgi:uncharacterized damage-inducible protein DinB
VSGIILYANPGQLLNTKAQEAVSMNWLQITMDTFARVRRFTVEAAERLPEERAEYRPVPEVMSFRQLLLHILSSYETLMVGWSAGTFDWGTKYNDANYPTLADVRREMPAATAALQEWLANRTPAELETPVAKLGGDPLLQMVNEFIRHEVHHRGQLFTYLRECGIVPPSMY